MTVKKSEYAASAMMQSMWVKIKWQD